jgi:hypothetical protein
MEKEHLNLKGNQGKIQAQIRESCTREQMGKCKKEKNLGWEEASPYKHRFG